jgi:predicted MFS family arabinose efflux permease
MATGCGLAVANNYYCQPLLREMAGGLHVPEAWAGYIPAATQAGYALGLLLFVPLGDMLERRRLIEVVLGAAVGTLLAVAIAPTFPLLVVASFVLGLVGITPQLLVPFAAHLAPAEERGRVVGTVMSGLLLGVLLARTVSGFVGQYLGWRAMYGIAAALTVLLLLTLRATLPRSAPSARLEYRRLMASLPRLIREEPVLRQSCLFGAGTFGAFSAFWSTLAFHLAQPPFEYGSEVVGLFGLVGVVGVLAASVVGRRGDRKNPLQMVGLGLGTMLLSYVVFWLFGDRLWGLLLGVILMDLGTQACHISNQTRIYALRPEARNRFNTVYMVAYFIGGGTGSSLGAYGWAVWGWQGVCAAGFVLLLVAFAVFLWVARSGLVRRGAAVVEV